jgi:hypothetical protein
MTVTGHYWSRNVEAVREWAIARLKADPHDRDAEDIADIEDWCRWWLENDPGDAGNYGAFERADANARQAWRGIYREYLRISGAESG